MAWQGNGMGAAWEQHAMCESACKGTALHPKTPTDSYIKLSPSKYFAVWTKFSITIKGNVCVTSGLRHDVDQICTLLGY